MPGGPQRASPRRHLLNAMREAGAETVADLDPMIRDRHRFALKLQYAKVTPERLHSAMKDPRRNDAREAHIGGVV
jgi:hypothetical protein